MTYQQKLKDQRWQKKRLELLNKAGWRCQSMGCEFSTEENRTLHVHHLVYLRGKDPWDYEDWAYMVVCESCHEVEQSLLEAAHLAIAQNPYLMQACSALSNLDSDTQLAISDALFGIVHSRPDARSHLLEILTHFEEFGRCYFSAGREFERKNKPV